MAEEQAATATGLSRKEKRAQRDAERAAAQRGKKRKAADTELDNDAEATKPKDEFDSKDDFVPLLDDSAAKPKDETSKKRKRTQDTTAPTPDASEKATKPAKKKRKPAAAPTAEGEDATEPTSKPANQKFIVFVGNLPYTTTDASLQQHFKSLQPFSMRHRTDPATKKSKGFAFIEFENYDRMKTALKLYHHSYFDPEAPEKSKLVTAEGDEPADPVKLRGRGRPKDKGRKINVELTAGGGGKGTDRMEKVRVKNVRLEEQRERRREVERKEKLNKEKKAGGKKVIASGEAKEEAAGGDGQNEGMHPSRLAMINR